MKRKLYECCECTFVFSASENNPNYCPMCGHGHTEFLADLESKEQEKKIRYFWVSYGFNIQGRIQLAFGGLGSFGDTYVNSKQVTDFAKKDVAEKYNCKESDVKVSIFNITEVSKEDYDEYFKEEDDKNEP